MICVSIGNMKFEKALELCQSEDLVELRMDLLNLNTRQYLQLLDTDSSKIVTCRKGGIDEEERLRVYTVAIEKKVRYIDIDLDSDRNLLCRFEQVLKQQKETDLILSYHNYEETPGKSLLEEIYDELWDGGADIVKIACKINEEKDIPLLLDLYKKEGRKVILGMGDKGIFTRVAALFLGSEFSFASPDKEQKTAPGQLSKKDFNEILGIMQP